MILYAARRLGWALFTALIASIAAFALFWAIPNVDPEYWLGGAEKGNDATRARAIEQYGLDDPLPVQYTRLMDSILSGDVACFYGCGNLRDAFLDALPVTLSLVIGAGLIAIVAGASATRAGGRTGSSPPPPRRPTRCPRSCWPRCCGAS